MEPTLGVLSLWLLFAGVHIGLATVAVRGALVRRLGENGFRAVFSLLAAVTFALVIAYYAAHRFDGLPGLGLGGVTWVRGLLMATVVVGFAFLGGAMATYPDSPYDLLTGERPRSPRGLERVTRHPFFVGVALLAGAHVLLVRHLVGTVFAGTLAAIAVLGAVHQDRKLVALRGRPYEEYLAATSLVPFAAVLAGRQRIAWLELPLGAMAGGVLVAALLRSVHDAIFAHGGVYVTGTVVGAAAVITLQSLLRARRRAASAAWSRDGSGAARA